MHKLEKGQSRPRLVDPCSAILFSTSSPVTVRISQEGESITTIDSNIEKTQLSTPLYYRIGDSIERGYNCIISNIIGPPLTILVVGLGICRAKCDIGYTPLYGYCNSWMRLKLGPLMNIDVSMNFANHPNSQPKANFEGDWLPLMQFWQKNLSKLVKNDLEFTRHSSRKLPSWNKRYKEYRLERAIKALYRSHLPTKDIFNGHCVTYNLFVYYCHLRDVEKTNITQLTENDMVWLLFIRDRELFNDTLFLHNTDK